MSRGITKTPQIRTDRKPTKIRRGNQPVEVRALRWCVGLTTSIIGILAILTFVCCFLLILGGAIALTVGLFNWEENANLFWGGLSVTATGLLLLMSAVIAYGASAALVLIERNTRR